MQIIWWGSFETLILKIVFQSQPNQFQQGLLPFYSAANSQIMIARAARKAGLVDIAIDKLSRCLQNFVSSLILKLDIAHQISIFLFAPWNPRSIPSTTCFLFLHS